MANIVSFVNYKGGVGKTTLAVEIAVSLAHHYKKRVLLADLDPQTNATFYLLALEKWEKWAKEKGSLKEIFNAVTSNSLQTLDVHKLILRDFVIIPKTKDFISLHLLPSHLELMTTDIDLAVKFGTQDLKDVRFSRMFLKNLWMSTTTLFAIVLRI